METIVLEAQSRQERGRSVRRAAGARVPVVLYGKEIDSQSLWVDATAFGHAFVKGGESTIFDLVIDGAKKPVPVLVRDVARAPLSYEIIHADLYQVKMGTEITADVAVKIVGESPAVKLGGTVMHNVDMLGVRCLPKNMPSEIVVDVSELVEFDTHITVKDIDFGVDVVSTTDPSVVVVGIAAPRVMEVEEEPVVTTSEDATDTKEEESDKKEE